MGESLEANTNTTDNSPVTSASVVRWGREPMAATVGGRIVLMSASAGNYYDLDEIGTDVWQRLSEPVRVGDLCDQLVVEYDGERDQIERDVLTLLRELAAHALIEVDG
jgi:hypothetical protein